MSEHQNQDPSSRRDILRDLEARIDAAIEEARPKLRKAFEELDARVDSAVREFRPRVDDAMEDVKPRVDRFVADVQPRLDGLLRRVESRIAELRQDLEDRAARSDRGNEGAEMPALPRTDDTAGSPAAGRDANSTDTGTGPTGV